jgi:hypothetical protein
VEVATVIEVDRRQVVAYRIAAHGLHRDTADPADLAVLDLGIQHSHLDTVRLAVAARTPEAAGDPLADERFALVWAFRGAPHLLRRAELRRLAGELWPYSDADAAARLGEWSRLKRAGDPGLTVFTRASQAMREVVTGTMTRGEVSGGVTARLPHGYGQDCRACKAHHIFGGLFQQIGIFAGVGLVPDGAATLITPLAERGPVPETSAGAGRLLRGYLALHGPATLTEAAGYLGTTRAQAAPVWPADELVEVRVDGRAAFLPADRVDALRDAPEPDLVRLLPALDPYLQARDRSVIVPDEARHKDLWRVLGNPGALLAGGDVVGSWRAKTTRKALTVTVTGYQKLAKGLRAAVTDEARRIASVRGVPDVAVAFDGAA